MPMFKKNLKLIATAIGLVAVLVMGLAMPGATQQNPLSRASVVNAISNAVAATLTAAEGDVFDTENAKFYSDTSVAFVYIPLHPASRSYQLFDPQELLAGKVVNMTMAALFLPDNTPFLPAGMYTLKIVDKTKYAIVDQAGKEVYSGLLLTEPTYGKPVPEWQLIVKASPKKAMTSVTVDSVQDACEDCIEIRIHWKCITIIIIIDW
jgi:hypothetical protein